jgi:glycosyltransferase involved in cell wall biosynthesis
MAESPAQRKLSIVVPVYNEERYLDIVMGRLTGLKLPEGVSMEIVAVDDCSKDSTPEKLKAWEAKGVKVVRHQVNQGKGAAVRTGFKSVSGDIVVVQDADLEYNPEEIPHLLVPLLDGRADAVFGARASFTGGGCHRVMYFWHYVINSFLTLACNMLANLTLHDMECCYKMFKREIVDKIELEEPRFGIEPEITIKVARLGCRIYEVPVSYSGRTYAEGKKIGWKDGVSALRCIVKYGILHR